MRPKYCFLDSLKMNLNMVIENLKFSLLNIVAPYISSTIGIDDFVLKVSLLMTIINIESLTTFLVPYQ